MSYLVTTFIFKMENPTSGILQNLEFGLRGTMNEYKKSIDIDFLQNYPTVLVETKTKKKKDERRTTV